MTFRNGFITGLLAGAMTFLLGLAIGMAVIIKPAKAKDDGRYAQSKLKGWFDSLKSSKGLCCSLADGVSVLDVDWDVKDGKYQVRLDGQWIEVPDEAVVKEPNRYGPAVVWPVTHPGTAQTEIRCFIAGAGT